MNTKPQNQISINQSLFLGALLILFFSIVLLSILILSDFPKHIIDSSSHQQDQHKLCTSKPYFQKIASQGDDISVSDNNNDASMNKYIKPIPIFEDYPSRITRLNQNHDIIYRNNSFASEYQFQISSAYKVKPNFAGHYSIAYWGCGTNCLQTAVIDHLTGQVYEGPTGSSFMFDQLYIDFRPNSKLLIFNPPDKEGNCVGFFGKCPQYYLWIDANICPTITE